MILRTRCPSCNSTYRLRTPPPPEGRKYRCTCGTVITIAYPEQVREFLREKGFSVTSEESPTTAPVNEGAEIEDPEGDALENQEEMDTLVDVPAATRPAEPSSPPPASTKDAGQPSPSSSQAARSTGGATEDAASKADLLKMNIVGDGGAGLTRPPRLDPLPKNEGRSASSLGTGEVAQFLAEKDGGQEATPADRERQELTSPLDLTNVPPLEDSLRREPDDADFDAPTVEQPAAARPDTTEAPAAVQAGPLASDTPPGMPEPMSIAPVGDFLPPPEELPDRPSEDPAGAATEPPAEAEPEEQAPPAPPAEDFWTAAKDDEPSGEPSVDATDDEVPAAVMPSWSGGSAFDRIGKSGDSKKKRKGGRKLTPGRRLLLAFKRLAIAGLILALLGAAAIGITIWHFNGQVPAVDVLGTYEPPTVTQVRSSDGQLLAEFFEQQRYVTPISEIPKNLQNAFVAAEDASFWVHEGLDYRGIIRAMLKNIEEGRMAQGASTITQQVARSFLLTREKKLARKIKEAILAHKIESNFDKEHILYLYLNQIFLGHGAYGVQAAAQLYFGKDASQLNLAEAALIAGLPQAPSRYSPNKNYRAAKQRQLYVLEQMVANEYITQAEANAAYDQELIFQKKRNKNLDIAPFYVEHVRKYLNDTYGSDVVNTQGLQVLLPIDVELQLAANQAVEDGVRRSDKIMGYRGPIERHEQEADRAKARQRIDRDRTLLALPYNPKFKLPEGPVSRSLIPALQEGEIVQGVVAQVGKTWAVVDIGSLRGVLPVKEFSWCHQVDPLRTFRYFTCKTLDDTLFPGDLIEVRVLKQKENFKRTLGSSWKGSAEFARLSMEQPPRPESALLSMRVSDGAILAMVGGKDYTGSEFNRATQAKRQVGSTFKPFCYAAALDHPEAGLTPSSIFLDAPIVEESRGSRGRLWRPKNAGGGFEGETTLRRGLMLSRNTVTLKVLQAVGVDYTAEYVKRFGFDLDRVEANPSMCLGTASRSLVEMAEAYSVFATLGNRRSSYFISEVRDRHGDVLEATLEGAYAENVMDPGTAYQVVRLTRDVVSSGTARKATVLGVPLSGKTGTTDNFHDAWFVGYTPEVVSLAWVGLDAHESMGKGQFGGDVALPVWIQYMEPTLKKYPPSDYTQPENIVMMIVDSKSGLLVRKGQYGAWVAFKKGTGPSKYAPAPDDVDTASFLTGEF